MSFLIYKHKKEKYFFFFLTILWSVFAFLYLKETKLAFASILLGAHGVIYASWKTGNIKKVFMLTCLILFFFKVYLLKVTLLSLTFSAIFGGSIIIGVLRFRSFVEDVAKQYDILESFWLEKSSSLFCYKETTTFLSIILISLIFMVGETLLTTPKFYELWVALGMYTVMGILISSTLNLFFIIKSPNLSHKVFRIIFGIVFILLTIFAVFNWLHIACTSPGFCPPNLPGIGAYQEMLFGYRAPTEEQLLVGRIYSLTHIGKIPPLMEGSMEVDFQRTLKLLMPLNNLNKLYVNIIVEGMTKSFPFTEKVFLDFIDGVGKYKFTNVNNQFN